MVLYGQNDENRLNVQKNIFYDILKREVVDVSTYTTELGQSPKKLANLLQKNLAMTFFYLCDKYYLRQMRTRLHPRQFVTRIF